MRFDEKEVKRLLQELPFYNVPIEKPYIKRLNNIDLLHELPLYNELGIAKKRPQTHLKDMLEVITLK